MIGASRWWHLALGAAAAIAVGVVALVEPAPAALGVAAVLAAYAGFWALVGRRAGTAGGGLAIVLSVATIAAAAVAAAFAPAAALFQFFAYPLLWSVARSFAWAVAANVALAVSVAAGSLVSLGTSPASLLQVGVTQSVTFAFSIVIGVWITRLESESRRRQELLDRLAAMQDELAALHRDAGVTSERERLARELHDTIAQSLAGLVLLGQRARREFADGRLTDETLELLESGARDALTETRALVAAGARIEPGRGIVETLERLLARFEREAGVAVVLDARVDAPLDRDAEVVLVRCVQEGLANARKHAGASQVRIELAVDGAAATVRVVDNGTGFDPDTVQEGFGLPGLRDRVALAGGTIRLDSNGAGTALEATLPGRAAG